MEGMKDMDGIFGGRRRLLSEHGGAKREGPKGEGSMMEMMVRKGLVDQKRNRLSFGCTGCLMKRMAEGDRQFDENCMDGDLKQCLVELKRPDTEAKLKPAEEKMQKAVAARYTAVFEEQKDELENMGAKFGEAVGNIIGEAMSGRRLLSFSSAARRLLGNHEKGDGKVMDAVGKLFDLSGEAQKQLGGMLSKVDIKAAMDSYADEVDLALKDCRKEHLEPMKTMISDFIKNSNREMLGLEAVYTEVKPQPDMESDLTTPAEASKASSPTGSTPPPPPVEPPLAGNNQISAATSMVAMAGTALTAAAITLLC
jgi:hypothetical protein